MSVALPHTGLSKQGLLACLVAMGCASCTVDASSSSPTPSPRHPSAPAHSVISVKGRTYAEECQPVAEAVVDVPLSKPGAHPPVRAIAGLWFEQAVAVVTNEPEGACGLWTLAVAPNLSSVAHGAIEAEVREGVANFGITASPVPKDPNNGMNN
jgi:hypothetical protein